MVKILEKQKNLGSKNPFPVCYHEGLKIFGRFLDVHGECYKIGKEKGWIESYFGLENVPLVPKNSAVVSHESGKVTVIFPELYRVGIEVKTVSSWTEIRNLYKRGYKKVEYGK